MMNYILNGHGKIPGIQEVPATVVFLTDAIPHFTPDISSKLLTIFLDA